MTATERRARLRATFREELDELLVALDHSLVALERAPGDAEALRTVLRIFHTLKGAARAVGLTEVEAACHAWEELLADLPPGASIDGTRLAALFAASDSLKRTAAELRGEMVPAASEPVLPAAHADPVPSVAPGPAVAVPTTPAMPTTPAVPTIPTLRVRADRLEDLASTASELIGLAARSEDHRERLTGLAFGLAMRGVASVSERSDALRDVQRRGRAARLDGRVLRQRARELADLVRAARARAFAEVCEPLPRLARDLAAQLGKEVELKVQDGAVEADRSVLDALRDPLVQLVRNAVDHGIERPHDRVAAGKPRRGTITIGAAMVGERLLVTVEDDGRGIDSEALRSRLAERGRHASSDQGVLARELLTAGVSTRETASAVSGRGVGVELARRAVEGMGGRVSLDWVPGRGTTFVLDCPSSLALTRIVQLDVGGKAVAVPTASVVRLLRVRVADVRSARGQEVLQVGGAPVPVASLAALLGPPFSDRGAAAVRPGVLLREGASSAVVLVDGLVSELEVVVSPLGDRSAEGINGAALLPDGATALVLNVPEIVRRTGIDRATPAQQGEERQRRVLVVDDSITTRTLERSLLEDAGYAVTVAVDGEAGWKTLSEGQFDVMVADVEMPELDGLGLCRRVRADPRLRGTPIILVTSLDTPADRQRGVEAGADAYLAKADFDRDVLVETIARLLDESA